MEHPQEIQALSQRILVQAARKIGGVGALARFLDVGEGTLAEWLAGRLVPSVEVVLKATSLLVDEPGEFRPAAASERLSEVEHRKTVDE